MHSKQVQGLPSDNIDCLGQMDRKAHKKIMTIVHLKTAQADARQSVQQESSQLKETGKLRGGKVVRAMLPTVKAPSFFFSFFLYKHDFSLVNATQDPRSIQSQSVTSIYNLYTCYSCC